MLTVFEIFPNTTQSPIIEAPADIDVLCSKDKTYNNHAGNQLYRAKIAAMADLYAAASAKNAKMKITKSIVSEMKESGSRFLRAAASAGGWTEISDQQARDKTSHALRFCAKHAKRNAAAAATAATTTNISHARRVSADTTASATDENPLQHQQQSGGVAAMPAETEQQKQQQAEDKFDTLRSHDLDAIFNEPVDGENEWDEVMTLAG